MPVPTALQFSQRAFSDAILSCYIYTITPTMEGMIQELSLRSFADSLQLSKLYLRQPVATLNTNGGVSIDS